LIIYSHRGHSDRHPENSIEGFREAIESGADGIETDVRQTADGVMVLFHDRMLPNRQRVSDLTRDQLRTAAAFRVPTLSEALHEFPNIHWLIELKSPVVAEPVTELLRATHPRPQITLISFWHHVAHDIAVATQLDYGISMGHSPRRESLTSILEHLSATDARAVIWNFEFLDARAVEQTLDAGYECLAYNVCDSHDYQQCVSWNVTGVIADQPRSVLSHGKDTKESLLYGTNILPMPEGID